MPELPETAAAAPVPNVPAPDDAGARPALRIARLKLRREFLRAASRGRRAARPGLVLQALPGTGGPLRLGFTMTKKVGNSVVRNRARRRLREAARLTLHDCPAAAAGDWDLVLIGRDTTATRDFARLVEDLRGALRQAGVCPKPMTTTP